MASQCCFRTYKCHKCSRVGHLQAVCPGDKGTQVERQKPEKQQDQRKSKSIRQLQTDEALGDMSNS